MEDMERRATAMMGELVAQRNAALDRCAMLAADLAMAQEKIKTLETPAVPAAPETLVKEEA